MEYRGVEYEVFPGNRPATWRWIVHLGAEQTTSGQIIGKREHATVAVRKAIDKALQSHRHNDRPNHTDDIAIVRAL